MGLKITRSCWSPWRNIAYKGFVRTDSNPPDLMSYVALSLDFYQILPICHEILETGNNRLNENRKMCGERNSQKISEFTDQEIGFESKTVRTLVRYCNHWAIGNSSGEQWSIWADIMTASCKSHCVNILPWYCMVGQVARQTALYSPYTLAYIVLIHLRDF